jgi:hypothetical protein
MDSQTNALYDNESFNRFEEISFNSKNNDNQTKPSNSRKLILKQLQQSDLTENQTQHSNDQLHQSSSFHTKPSHLYLRHHGMLLGKHLILLNILQILSY